MSVPSVPQRGAGRPSADTGRPGGAVAPASTGRPGRGSRRSPSPDRGITLPPDVQWRRVHPITPLLEGWKGITAVLAFLLWQNVEYVMDAYSAIQDYQGHVTAQVVLTAGLGVLGVLVAVGLVLWLSWRMRSYAVDRDAVYLRTGILNRQLRTARLPRIQSVDIIHPLLGRIFGLGRLKVEVAGGGDSNVTIGFLRTRELETLRDRIMSLAAGTELHGEGVEPYTAERVDVNPASPPPLGEPGTAADPPSTPLGFEGAAAAPPLPAGRVQGREHDLYEVETRVLIGSMLRSGATITAAALMLSFLVLLTVWFATGVLGRAGVLPAIFSSVLPMLTIPLAFGGYVWNRFDKGWRFRAAATPAGIRTSFGLTAETSSTLPPGRVHGVQLEQGLLWRGPDWWRVEVSVAGRSAAEVKSSGVEDTGANVLLPVGRRDTALRALWLVAPDLGVADPDAFLAAALTGSDQDGVGDVHLDVGAPGRGFIRISPRGRMFSPLAWRREAIALTDTCVVLRLGRLRRRISVIPYERIQSLRLVQGPFARRRGLVALHLDMVDAEIGRSLSNLDLSDAAAIERVISERALRRRRQERLDRWLQRAAETP
ncbi:MAG: hypothetical protein E7Z94_02555 [Actinomyces ruminicola]|nr:hypothetical protein [Actinomyces ruminicola]